MNPVHNAFDLWELTQLYLEVHGSAYWLLHFDGLLDVPNQIWVLPAHLVAPQREPNSSKIVDYRKPPSEPNDSPMPDAAFVITARFAIESCGTCAFGPAIWCRTS